jgi:hypothetical protein
MRIERNGDNFSGMASESGHLFTCDGAPYFSRVIERACADFISKGYIEGHAIDGVFMSLKWMDKISSRGVPEFAGTIVASCKELISVFVEAAVGEWEYVAL